MKRVIFNQKGGVGKTSIAVNIAAAMASLGKKVLLVDLDLQSNASQYVLGEEWQKCTKTLFDFFQGTLSFSLFRDDLEEITCETKFSNLYVVPSSLALAELQNKLESRYKILKFSESLVNLCQEQKFDEVIIDAPPQMNFFTMSALIASERVLIPIDCDSFSAEALKQVIEIVKEVANDHNKNLIVEGIVINHFQSQAKHPTMVIQSLIDQGLPILKPYLSSSVVMKESHSLAKPLVYYKSEHKLTQEFLILAKLFLVNNSTKNSKAKKIPQNQPNI